jgi:hypothetical protein
MQRGRLAVGFATSVVGPKGARQNRARMPKVYISSTKVDLDSERETVLRALVDARYQPLHS